MTKNPKTLFESSKSAQFKLIYQIKTKKVNKNKNQTQKSTKTPAIYILKTIIDSTQLEFNGVCQYKRKVSSIHLSIHLQPESPTTCLQSFISFKGNIKGKKHLIYTHIIRMTQVLKP